MRSLPRGPTRLKSYKILRAQSLCKKRELGVRERERRGCVLCVALGGGFHGHTHTHSQTMRMDIGTTIAFDRVDIFRQWIFDGPRGSAAQEQQTESENIRPGILPRYLFPSLSLSLSGLYYYRIYSIVYYIYSLVGSCVHVFRGNNRRLNQGSSCIIYR